MTEELELDPHFADEYKNLKQKRSINFIRLKVDGKTIHVERTGKANSLPELANTLDDIHCCFLVYAIQGESEDGLIRMERIFTITYTPSMAKPDEKLVYEMQKGKSISKATRGAIEIHVTTKEDLRRRINGVSFGVRKAAKDESDEDEPKSNWMDE